MEYKIMIDSFEGPLDLLLHLIKQSDIDIYDIKIEEITKQYLDFINEMEKLNLNIASEYLVMAAELIEIKSHLLIPNNEKLIEDQEEIDPREELINRLIEYKKYKEAAIKFKDLEEQRHEYFTKDISFLEEYRTENIEVEDDLNLDMLLEAFNNLMLKKEDLKPLNTKVTNKEYSVTKRSEEIKKILRQRKKLEFTELFEENNKSFMIVTFLSVLSLFKNNLINIEQEQNFNKIYLISKGCE